MYEDVSSVIRHKTYYIAQCTQTGTFDCYIIYAVITCTHGCMTWIMVYSLARPIVRLDYITSITSFAVLMIECCHPSLNSHVLWLASICEITLFGWVQSLLFSYSTNISNYSFSMSSRSHTVGYLNDAVDNSHHIKNWQTGYPAHTWHTCTISYYWLLDCDLQPQVKTALYQFSFRDKNDIIFGWCSTLNPFWKC